MDRITKSYVASFREEQSLPADVDPPKLFEHFVNYCIVSDAHDEEFDIDSVHTGGGNDLGIDGLAILVNGVLVETVEDAEQLLEVNKRLEVRFVFVQAKSASSFTGSEMSEFAHGVSEFFAETPAFPTNERIDRMRAVMSWIYDHSSAFKQGRPSCELWFVSTGKWQNDDQLLTRLAKAESALAALSLFDEVRYRAMGSSEIQASWTKTKNSVAADFQFPKRATLADIPGVSESYLGIVSAAEFMKVISDENGIRRQIFFDNVRDYQGDNSVNGEIATSLSTGEGRSRFAVLNNGITLVARQLRIVGDKFTVADYQIVNGCQTSHVLYNNRDSLDSDMQVPFKVIATDDEDVISSIASATNRQTQVTAEDLIALESFQKRLEAYFSSYEDRQRLYYERRSKQFATVTGIEKVRIITKPLLIRAFGAMFGNEPHRAARYYAALKVQVGGSIFHEGHQLAPYYSAAFAYYKLEYLFRNGQLPVAYKPARYHLLMAVRVLAAGFQVPQLTANKVEGYAAQINKLLWDDSEALAIFKKACAVIDEARGEQALDGDLVKVQAFTDKVTDLLRPNK